MQGIGEIAKNTHTRQMYVYYDNNQKQLIMRKNPAIQDVYFSIINILSTHYHHRVVTHQISCKHNVSGSKGNVAKVIEIFKECEKFLALENKRRSYRKELKYLSYIREKNETIEQLTMRNSFKKKTLRLKIPFPSNSKKELLLEQVLTFEVSLSITCDSVVMDAPLMIKA